MPFQRRSVARIPHGRCFKHSHSIDVSCRTVVVCIKLLPLLLLYWITNAGFSFSVTTAFRGGGSSPDSTDLLIFGAGELGCRVARLWQKAHPGSRVVGVTLSKASHPQLQALGLEPVTVADLFAVAPRPSFKHVVFSAPPSRNRNMQLGAYASSVAGAALFWDGKSEEGGAARKGPGFVFTSSAGVFAEDSGGEVDETSPVSESPSAKLLLEAEESTHLAGGTVLRLAGLYDAYQGPHMYWLKVGTIKGSPDGLINMLHYDDAAAAVMATLNQGFDAHGKTFVVSDGTPVTRAGIIQATLKASPFVNSPVPIFEDPSPSQLALPGGSGAGKRLDATRAHEELLWEPKHPSFAAFMAQL